MHEGLFMRKPETAELLTAIRANCMECSGGSKKEVRYCKITYCKLYPYRCDMRKKDDLEEQNQQLELELITT